MAVWLIWVRYVESLLFASLSLVCANENRVNADIGIAAALIIVVGTHWYDVPLIGPFDPLHMGTHFSGLHASDCGAICWPAFPTLVDPVLFPATARASVVARIVNVMNLNAHNDFFLPLGL